MSRLALIDFAAFRAVKHHPGREVICEVLKTMLKPSSHKQYVVCFKRLPCAIADKLAASFRHHIDLVFRVRRLRVSAAWRVKLCYQRPVLKKRDHALLLRSRQTFERVVEIYFEAIIS